MDGDVVCGSGSQVLGRCNIAWGTIAARTIVPGAIALRTIASRTPVRCGSVGGIDELRVGSVTIIEFWDSVFGPRKTYMGVGIHVMDGGGDHSGVVTRANGVGQRGVTRWFGTSAR